ncbi:hypothetical protein [Aquipuribacter hungaricus]|uniref:Uncharacterized protein n=1 Tax=Aquipuribacter hungaricus TaxID=545624 RepID=A0ABV7WIW6_9MICO
MQTSLTAPAAGRAAPPLLVLLRRWPTALAVGLAAALWGVDTVTAAQLLPVLPLLYVVLAVLQRPRASWPALLVSVVALGALQSRGTVDHVLAVTTVAAVVALAGAVHHGRDRGTDLGSHPGRQPGGHAGRALLARQVVGYVLFAGVAVVALLAAPDVGRWVLAVGWLGHGVWDLVHLRRREVVSRSYAEWCGALDVLVALQLVLLR